jgi:hypothetical protein
MAEEVPVQVIDFIVAHCSDLRLAPHISKDFPFALILPLDAGNIPAGLLAGNKVPHQTRPLYRITLYRTLVSYRSAPPNAYSAARPSMILSDG